MTTIDAVRAREVLDSRGDPTVHVVVESDGTAGAFTVPSGASTGTHEPRTKRDCGTRFRGRGVRDAVDTVEGEIAGAVVGRDVRDQRGLDRRLRELDGTADLRRLGANAVLGVSGAALRTASRVAGQPLYEYVGDGESGRIPTPMVNILSGGLHARGGIEVQDVLVVPVGSETYTGALETVWEVRQSVRGLILDRGERPLVADEGGFAPPLDGASAAFNLVCAGIEAAGFVPGSDVALAVDVAATHFYDPERREYRLESEGKTLGTTGLVERVLAWVDRYPIVSVEDPLSEDDWAGWASLADRLPGGVQLLGDDLLVTDRDRLDRAVEEKAANAVLVKPNQAGTITSALEVCDRATSAGLAAVISARSGETCDSTIADLAVGLNAGQIKIGSLARSERLAKYNRLLAIEAETGGRLAALDTGTPSG